MTLWEQLDNTLLASPEIVEYDIAKEHCLAYLQGKKKWKELSNTIQNFLSEFEKVSDYRGITPFPRN